jgi:transcription termination/antitermination protein NusA
MELETKQLVLAIRQIAEEKNLDEGQVQDIIEQAITAAYRKDFGDHDQEMRSVININTGDVQVFAKKNVVDKVQNEVIEISLDDAKKIKKDSKLKDIVEVTDRPKSFGRVAAQTAKQVILQRLREAEREVILSEFEDKIGKVLVGNVSRVESRVVRIDLGKATGIMPKSEQIQGEIYSTGSRLKVYLKDVERTNRGPQLILSRAHTEFIVHLFRNEVPEMENGAVEIKTIAREAGVRTKIAVASTVPGVDPVGTYVGGHGTRVDAVRSEIGDREKIDIIPYDEEPEVFIRSALAPTEVESVVINEKEKTAEVKVDETQLSIGIGRGGQNVRLASKLSGYEIDISASEDSNKDDLKSVEKKEKQLTKNNATKPTQKKLPRKEELEESLISAIDDAADDKNVVKKIEQEENKPKKGGESVDITDKKKPGI